MMWPILASVNFISAIFSYAILAALFTREHWRRRGTILSVAGIILCAEIWLIPQALVRFLFHAANVLSSLWFADYLVAGFAIILMNRVTANISRDLADAAELDRFDRWQIFRHIIFPFVRRPLILLGFLLLLATWMNFLPRDFPMLARFQPATPDAIELPPLVFLSIGSSVALVALHFLSTKFLREKSRRLQRANR